LAAKEKTLSGGAAFPLVETRVWGLPLENANGIGALWPASSTLHWGWSPFYAGTASDSLDQRYYSSGTGRFMSPEPLGLNAAKLQNPGSWNRYAYAYGDPINLVDPTGRTPCGDLFFKGQVDACYDPCDPATWENGFMPAPDPSCYGPGGDDGGDPGEEAWKCPERYQGYIDAYDSYAAATGLSEANVLALSSIESNWGEGRFATEGHSFFNFESVSTGETEPSKFVVKYQTGWLRAKNPLKKGVDLYSYVATFASDSDSFKSFAASKVGQALKGVNDPKTFGSIANNGAIHAGADPAFVDRAQTFAKCLQQQ